jgi:hypothetical protein
MSYKTGPVIIWGGDDMKKPKVFLLFLAAALIVFSGTQGVVENAFSLSGIAYAQEDWKSEFEDVCSKTQDAMMFSTEELKKLIARCDALKPRIEKLDESQSKVYGRRLQLCRELLVFVLESKEKK